VKSACAHAGAVTKTYVGSDDTYRWCGDCFTILEGAEPSAEALVEAAARADVSEANEEDYTRSCHGRMENGPDKAFARCGLCGCIDYELYEGDRCRCRKRHPKAAQ
jgi:hypothetical protein